MPDRNWAANHPEVGMVFHLEIGSSSVYLIEIISIDRRIHIRYGYNPHKYKGKEYKYHWEGTTSYAPRDWSTKICNAERTALLKLLDRNKGHTWEV
ncbi:MAG: hypothetical protein GWN31_03970 [Candidatus Thorarchaeota archaeon]|nr:hypothetical protein [Candidatus Thorarchaeota archaeon]NIW13090.1 hypothetical protein [Candidatus Thorarchaeota archaeon]